MNARFKRGLIEFEPSAKILYVKVPGTGESSFALSGVTPIYASMSVRSPGAARGSAR